MARPKRRIDLETVHRLADYAGLPLPEDRANVQLEFLKGQIETLESWERDFKLGFWFEHGEFSFVRPAVIYRPVWEHPTPLNKRVAKAAVKLPAKKAAKPPVKKAAKQATKKPLARARKRR